MTDQIKVSQEQFNQQLEIIRLGHYAQKVIFVDGQAGCGKTLFSPVIAALERVELLTYAYNIEYICSLYYLGKMSSDAANSMVRLWTDLQLYNTMMGREINFRPSDLSSAFMDINPWRYLQRIFMKGDEHTPARIEAQQPILNLTTHNLLPIADPVMAGLGDRAVFIEIVRHPLYMIKQQDLNMANVIEDTRDFSIYFRWGNRQIPYWARGWEDRYVASNSMERTIYGIEYLTALTAKKKALYQEKYQSTIVTIPFEQFVLNPWEYMEQMTKAIGTQMTPATYRVLKKQNVPRKRIADGIALEIYKRCGWVPPQAGADERAELNNRRKIAEKQASPEAMAALDRLSRDYEHKYMVGLL